MKKKTVIAAVCMLIALVGVVATFLAYKPAHREPLARIWEIPTVSETLTGIVEEKVSVVAVLNDSYIYKLFYEDTVRTTPRPIGRSPDGISYYRRYFDDGETIKLGTINPFIIGMGETAIVDNVLYFCVTSADEMGSENNNLYGIDLATNQLEVYYTDNEVIPIMEIFAYNNKLLFLKTKRNGDDAHSYFEIFDPKDGSIKKVNEHIVNHPLDTGSVIMTCFINGDTVYAWVDEYEEDGTRISTIRAYDKSFRCIQTISLGEVSDYIKESRVDQIAVFGDYIYLHNLSGYNVVGKIENDTIKAVLKKRDLMLRPNEKSGKMQDIQMFYVRQTNSYYILDIENDEITEKSLEPFEDYITRGAQINADTVLIIQEGKPGEHISDKPYRYIICNIDSLK
ncbi:MAG: hypothetical protein LBT88_08250 [Oscillospiraceae bacterium]|jgi:hypothetical protein|nr:hypothetical protein [Oscillospiraceae bacterium]